MPLPVTCAATLARVAWGWTAFYCSCIRSLSRDRIVTVMTAKTERSAELRQASPFAGALTQEEIARTIRREKEQARTR
jgi:hypothetical protein